MKNIKIFACPTAEEFTQEICDCLGLEMGKINHQKLNKNYIETIVGQWKRLNIETVEDAMKIVEGTALNMGVKVSE